MQRHQSITETIEGIMKKIAIYGAGGFGREVLMLIEQINENNKQWEIIGFFDDGMSERVEINNFPILGGIKELNEWHEEISIVLAIGNPLTKRNLIVQIKNEKIKYATLIHPNVQISNSFVKIGEGSIITAGCIITVNIVIGKHVILNLGCTVGHDAVIEDFCSFMPSVNISGEVVIRECVFAGTGTKIINQLEVGANTIIGAGAVVYKNLPPNCTAVGIPAKPIKFHSSN